MDGDRDGATRAASPTRLLITESDVTALRTRHGLGRAEHVAAVEAAWREQADGTAALLDRQSLVTDPDPDAPRPRSFKLLCAALARRGVIATVTYAAGYGRPLDYRIQLCSAATGRLMSIVEGEAVSHWSTGAVTAAATRALAREDARVLALVGTGTYAFDQATFIAQVRPIVEVRCFGRDAARRTAFAARLAEALPAVRVRAVADVQAAIDGADIVTTVTTSHTPVFDGALLRPGVHVNAIGMHYPRTREVDSDTVRRSRVFVDDVAQTFEEKGEILIPLASGEIARDHVLGPMSAVLSGAIAGRRTADELTLFASGGTAIEKAAVAALIDERARAAGVGRPL